MYRLRAICAPSVTAEMRRRLAETSGVTAIVCHPGAEASGLDVLEADVAGDAVDDVLHTLATGEGSDESEVTIRPTDDVQRYRFDGQRALRIDDDEGEDLGISAASSAFRRLTRVDLQYGMLMAAAALVATAGLIGGLPIAVVGAMAFSPDLGRLNAMSFAIITREGALFRRGALSLLVGLTTTVVVALVVTLLLSAGVLEDPLAGVPDLLVDYITVLDGVTVTVAIGAGVAAMVVFITDHGTAAVGVGVSGHDHAGRRLHRDRARRAGLDRRGRRAHRAVGQRRLRGGRRRRHRARPPEAPPATSASTAHHAGPQPGVTGPRRADSEVSTLGA